jgi:hypothetical protein
MEMAAFPLHEVLDSSSQLEENLFVFLGPDSQTNLSLIRLVSGATDDSLPNVSASAITDAPFGVRCFREQGATIDFVQLSSLNFDSNAPKLLSVCFILNEPSKVLH